MELNQISHALNAQFFKKKYNIYNIINNNKKMNFIEFEKYHDLEFFLK